MIGIYYIAVKVPYSVLGIGTPKSVNALGFFHINSFLCDIILVQVPGPFSMYSVELLVASLLLFSI